MNKTNNYQYWNQFLKQLIICQDNAEKIKLIASISNANKPRILSFMNAHAANLLFTDDDFKGEILSSEYLLRDGAGIHLLMSLLRLESGINLNGTDFIPEILNSYNKKMVVSVYGTKGEFLEEGVTAIKKMGFQTIHSEDGFQKNAYYLEKFKSQKPNLVILAMGMPKQEKLSVILKNNSDKEDNVLIINGGGIIDFMSEKVQRSPLFMQKIGCEWLFRLINDPRRLWKRNIGSILFLIRAVNFKLFKMIVKD